MKYWTIVVFFIFSLFPSSFISAQKQSNEQIRTLISKYKEDIRGPYKDIRWYCKDGSVIPPKEKCPEPGGVQRARYKTEVVDLSKSNHIYLGQILSTTENEDFWDNSNSQSRFKQYQLEKYLRAADDGWILKKAQFYRGAIQVEDEEEWGVKFFQWLLADKDFLNRHFFLIRQAARDIPHQGDNSRSQNIRALSKKISEDYTGFIDLRVKIHGQPEFADIQKVKAFKVKHQAKLTPTSQKDMDALIKDMESFYQEKTLKSLSKYLKNYPQSSTVYTSFQKLVNTYPEQNMSAEKLRDIAQLMWDIRIDTQKNPNPKHRMALIDLSVELEDFIFREINEWQPKNLKDLLSKTYYLSMTAAASGFLENWEWEETNAAFVANLNEDNLSIEQLSAMNQLANRWTEWGAAMVRANYNHDVELFAGFEPKSLGFIDDRIRASVLLPLGNSVSRLGEVLANETGMSNQVMGISGQSQMRGLNPGYAFGELVVVSGSADDMEVSKEKIYIFDRPSSDLKPVAGIATVSEGNAVSHVQLLARNLGIPNAVISYQNLESLKKYAGQKVFYAVSNKGTIIMKPAEKMSAEEKKLFEVKQRSEERIEVPVEKIDLSQTKVINLRTVNATSSGKLCGPKAANLGQLKSMFPDQVVEGLVIPFGIFRAHFNQEMPGHPCTYWEFINTTFEDARIMEEEGRQASDIEVFVLSELEKLRVDILKIKLDEQFISNLKAEFEKTFGASIGKVPVFLRSDTNMEDLKDFTGAGLNLTLFNVVNTEKILQGIKEVWASPYSERSYKWRQRYLLNPENVFPSILIIPTVDVDYSGVLITTGISNGVAEDLTIAFNRGAGGAVDGQASESYLIHQKRAHELLSPAREPSYRKLPETGGSNMLAATFERPILNKQNLIDVWDFAAQIRSRLPNSPGVETSGPFDIEFGFKDNKLWLFQVRPFVENKSAKASLYLESITPKSPGNKTVSLNKAI
jgi:pyruvate phosphate dikinase-like enzyme